MGILPAKDNTSKPVRMPFTNTEEAALRTGVELHGTGAWAVILGSGRFAPTRTNVDLKNKWRNMATGIEKGAAEKKRLGRLDRKRPASALPPAADIRVAKAKRLPVDELVGLRPYLSDIHRLYQETEGLKHASSSYMNKQPDINAKMRAILIDWLVEVHLKFKLVPETLYLTVSLLDRYLDRREVSRPKLQLVGVTALLIASKYEEIYPPELRDLVYICDRAYSRDEILGMEETVLKTLEYQITIPSAHAFLVRYLKAAHADKRIVQLSCYILDGTLQSYALLHYLPSQLAAAAVLIARRCVGRNSWSPTLLRYAQYCEEDILPVARAVLAEKKSSISTGELRAVNKKYSSSRYGEVARMEILSDF